MRRLLLALLLLPSPALAKDLRGHLGMGFVLPVAVPVGEGETAALPMLSLKYGFPTGDPKMNIALQAEVGAAWQSGADAVIHAGGRLSFGVVAEDNMNLFLGAGAGVDVQAGATVFRVQPVMGADFFLFGLENLGFTAEWGVAVDLGATTTLALVPAFQVHYYF